MGQKRGEDAQELPPGSASTLCSPTGPGGGAPELPPARVAGPGLLLVSVCACLGERGLAWPGTAFPWQTRSLQAGQEASSGGQQALLGSMDSRAGATHGLGARPIPNSLSH